MQIDRFSVRFEATCRQTSFIAVLCKSRGVQLDTVLASLWGVSLVVAYSDRPWGRITRREASTVIETLLAMPLAPKVAEAEERSDRRYAEDLNLGLTDRSHLDA